MKLFDLLHLQLPTLTPDTCKLHLATWNGQEHPLDVFLAGDFPEWQRWQSKRNFERPYVVSLIAMGGNRWLFAGLYRSGEPERHEAEGMWLYPLVEEPACQELTGRLVIDFARSGRQSYLVAENWADGLLVRQLLEEPLSIAEFPGFKTVNLSWDELRVVVAQALPSWRAALSSVAGVYLITDTRSGGLYVGSATGQGGLWQRWSAYADNGHGGNTELRRLLSDEGPDRQRAFRYAILEIADTHASAEEVLRRESHWKAILLTREGGLNAN
jgi:hypothetical protein